MADLMETSQRAVDRVQHFLKEAGLESASITALEKKLLNEKHRRRKLLAKARKLKFRFRAVLEDLKATEIEIDNVTVNIKNIEDNLPNSE